MDSQAFVRLSTLFVPDRLPIPDYHPACCLWLFVGYWPSTLAPDVRPRPFIQCRRRMRRTRVDALCHVVCDPVTPRLDGEQPSSRVTKYRAGSVVRQCEYWSRPLLNRVVGVSSRRRDRRMTLTLLSSFVVLSRHTALGSGQLVCPCQVGEMGVSPRRSVCRRGQIDN